MTRPGPQTLPAEAPQAASKGSAEQVLAFVLDGKVFGIPLTMVAEIQLFQPLNRMPHMHKGVEGLLDLRGQVIPVVNLRARLGMPPGAEDHAGTSILVIEAGGFKTGLLVDHVDGVVDPGSARFREASRLLAGKNGGWVTGFLVQGERVVCLLDPSRAANPSPPGAKGSVKVADGDLENRLDDGLRELIALAPGRDSTQGRVVPQIAAAIAHTETEMDKVLERVEGMLHSTDKVFNGIARLKQEASLGHLKGEEERIAELEKVGQQIQDGIFQAMQFCQFQDIARQKLERVLRHIQGIQSAVGTQFKEGVKYR